MKTKIEMTLAADRHAAAQAIDTTLRTLVLDARAQVGDLVAIGQDTFIVRTRRWVIDGHGDQTLVFELDHPPRP